MLGPPQKPVCDYIDFDEGGGSLVYSTGKEVLHYSLSGTKSDDFIDKRSYKGGAMPYTIKICPEDAAQNFVMVAIGFRLEF